MRISRLNEISKRGFRRLVWRAVRRLFITCTWHAGREGRGVAALFLQHCTMILKTKIIIKHCNVSNTTGNISSKSSGRFNINNAMQGSRISDLLRHIIGRNQYMTLQCKMKMTCAAETRVETAKVKLILRTVETNILSYLIVTTKLNRARNAKLKDNVTILHYQIYY